MGMLDLEPSIKALKNEKGFYFCPMAGMAEIFNKSSEYKKAGLTVFLAFSPEKKPLEYVLFKDKNPIYAHTSYENVAYRADVYMIINNEE